MHNHLDRNLIGYGPNPPDPQWPNEARVAVSFVLNYEEGGENRPAHEHGIHLRVRLASRGVAHLARV